MNRITKLHLYSALYCSALISLNWFRTTKYARVEGVTSESVAPVALALLLSSGIIVALSWRVISLARQRLEAGERVLPGRWIESWSVLIYALPLLWHNVHGWSWRAPDGVIATSSGGFGSELSSWVFVFAICGILLAQVQSRLSAR